MGNKNSKATEETSVKPFTLKYQVLEEELGKGTFGTVYTCINRETGTQYAVKKIPVGKLDLDALFHIKKESLISSCLQHINIAKYFEGFTEERCCYMVFEKVQGRDLFTEISAKDHYSEQDARNYIKQILTAVQHCHRLGVIHRDLKPTNILLQAADNVIKLVDFGVAVTARNDMKYLHGLAGCPMYMAPEMVARMAYGKAVDMWACGLLLYNLTSGIHPFQGHSDEDVYNEIRSGRVDYPRDEFEGISEACIDLMRDLLFYDDDERLTAEQALNHEFIITDDAAATSHRQLTVNYLKDFHVALWQSHGNALHNGREQMRGSLGSIHDQHGSTSSDDSRQ